MHYATLTQVRNYLRLTDTETDDDSQLTDFINQAVIAIDKYSRRRFDIYRATRNYDAPHAGKVERMGVYSVEMWVYQMNAVADAFSLRLRLDTDLLEVIEFLNGDGSEIEVADYVFKPANEYPKFVINLRRSSDVMWQSNSAGSYEQVISIDGYWGYHPRYPDAFIDSLDTVQDNPLTNSATTLTVSNADGTAGDLAFPRFQAGQMLRLQSGTSTVTEFVFVIEVNDDTNELRIARGYNGTTAAEHVQTTGIDIFRPYKNIELGCIRAVAHAYRLKDTDVESVARIIGTGVQITPESLPATVRQLLPHRRAVGKGLSD